VTAAPTSHSNGRAIPGRARRRFGSASLVLLHNPMLRVVGRRALFAVPLLFVVSALSFLLVSLTPGDAAREILGTNPPPGAYPKLRHALGLDLPIQEQYWRWLTHAVRGDLGGSLVTSERVTHVIDPRLPVTLSLMLCALLVTVGIGVPVGLFSAVRGGVAGRFIDGMALVGFALPAFWIGAVLIAVFSVQLKWFPVVGYVPLSESPSRWLASLALPVTALALHAVAAVAKQTREAILDVRSSEFIRMARANGISPASVLFRHTLKNAAIRIVTIVGLLAVSLLGGTVLVESVFALPGLGGLAVNVALQHDLPFVQGIVVYFTLIVVVINLLIDLIYTLLNPRVRTA
jgi:peptide/nickel transport system permease protein